MHSSTNHDSHRRSVIKAGVISALVSPSALAHSTNPAKIRIGQIGVGHGHANKLSVYRSLPDYEIVGIVEPDQKLRDQAMQQPAFRDLRWMTMEQLLEMPDLSAVLVETEVKDLLPVAEKCVSRGIHIHIDKPAGESLSQFKKILSIAKQKKLLVQMGYMYRYNPAILLLKQFLREGWLGDIFEVHAVMSKVVAPEGRIAHAAYRGGMMFELGCHLIDLVHSILGEPSQVTGFHQHVSPSNDALLDNALAVLEYPRALATVKSSAQEVDGNARRHLVVCGTKGTFHVQPLDNPSVRLTLAESVSSYKSGQQEISFPKFTRYIADAIDMAKIIRGEKETDFDYEHDLSVQRTVLQASSLTR
ncbi:MAG: Gfo/Idh/MocA family protein [Pirellula sp.]|nr:Gfo/Idh/MocA family oxidoreductase [Pirellula sp.]